MKVTYENLMTFVSLFQLALYQVMEPTPWVTYYSVL